MTRIPRRITVLAATVAFVGSWFLPVNGIDNPGWKAFRVALAPVWPYDGYSADGFLGALVSVASALTNIWFLIVVAMLLRKDRLTPAVLPVLVATIVLNASWLAGPASAWGVGYFVWVGSFILLALAAGVKETVRVSGESPAAV